MSIVNDFTRELGDKYREYLRDVSTMAPSMQTLGLLLELCTPGCKVLDLGTGFSSYVLYYYSIHRDLYVCSVDDTQQWLVKSKSYCGLKLDDIDTRHVWDTWDSFVKFRTTKFDVVFMDLGTTRRRPDYYATVLSKFCDERTLILFDDMHKRPLRDAVTKALRPYDYIDIPVKDRTIDEFGRYCKLIFRLRPKEAV